MNLICLVGQTLLMLCTLKQNIKLTTTKETFSSSGSFFLSHNVYFLSFIYISEWFCLLQLYSLILAEIKVKKNGVLTFQKRHKMYWQDDIWYNIALLWNSTFAVFIVTISNHDDETQVTFIFHFYYEGCAVCVCQIKLNYGWPMEQTNWERKIGWPSLFSLHCMVTIYACMFIQLTVNWLISCENFYDDWLILLWVWSIWLIGAGSHLLWPSGLDASIFCTLYGWLISMP